MSLQQHASQIKTKLSTSALYNALRQDRMIFVCALIFLLLVIVSVCAPLLAPYNPYALDSIDILNAELPPQWLTEVQTPFLFGTDGQGRDVYSTLLYGMRLSLLIGFSAVALQAIIGISIGLIAGYFGGKIDTLLMRIADIQLSFSTLMLAIIVLAIVRTWLGNEHYNALSVGILIIVLGLAEWPQFARITRASILAEKQKEYVQAAQLMGYPSRRIILRHLFPNALTPILTLSVIQIANAIISEASLSFIGLGLPAIEPSLGSLIRHGFEYIFSDAWWIAAIPAAVLVLLVLVINLLGDWLVAFINPKVHKG